MERHYGISPRWSNDLDDRINFIVRGTDKVAAVSIQHRLRRVLDPTTPLAYVFLPILREPNSSPIRVADLITRLVRPSAIRWHLAEPFLDAAKAPQSFDDLAAAARHYLPSLRDGMFDAFRLAAFDRKLSPQLRHEVALSELAKTVESPDAAALERVCQAVRRPLADQVAALQDYDVGRWEAERSRSSALSRPRTSRDSNSGSPTDRPVTATRTGACALPSLSP